MTTPPYGSSSNNNDDNDDHDDQHQDPTSGQSPYGTNWQTPESSGSTAYGQQDGQAQQPSYGQYGYGDQSQQDSQAQQPGYGQYGYGDQSQQSQYGAYSDPSQQQNQYGQYGAYQQYQQPQQNQTVQDSKGFFGALFDFNFDNFVSVKYAKFIYILAIILAGLALLLGWLFPAIAMFSESAGLGLTMLLLGWIPIAVIALFQLIFIRMFLEFVIASVKTADNTSRLVEK